MWCTNVYFHNFNFYNFYFYNSNIMYYENAGSYTALANLTTNTAEMPTIGTKLM